MKFFFFFLMIKFDKMKQPNLQLGDIYFWRFSSYV